MENYSKHFLQVSAPLISVQFNEKGILHKELVEAFVKYDVKDAIWDNFMIRNRIPVIKYRIKYIETHEALWKGKNDKKGDEHSQLSPFNANSDIFPNGILSEKWFKRYAEDRSFAHIYVTSLEGGPKDDELQIEYINKLKSICGELNAHLTVVMASQSEDIDADHERVNRIRLLTGISKGNEMIYINKHHDPARSDIESFVDNLFNGYKTVASDFYTHIASNIRQRHRKYYSFPALSNLNTRVELTPLFLEARITLKLGFISQFIRPNNLETSIKYLVNAYQNLIDVSLSVRDVMSDPEVSDLDLNFYRRLRMLIDITAFHIVKGYFSLEEPLIALKKYSTHIANVLESFDYGDKNLQWSSTQYQLLAELMNMVPRSILIETSLKGSKKRNKNQILKVHFGGVRLFENHKFELISDPAFSYLEAYRLFKKEKHQFYSHIDILTNDTDIIHKRIGILKKAAGSLKTTVEKCYSDVELDSFFSYIYWQIAEEYKKLNSPDEESYIAYCEKSFEHIPRSQMALRQTLLKRLLSVTHEGKLSNRTISQVLEAATYSSDIVLPRNAFNNFTFPISLEVGDTSLFMIEPIIIGKDENGELKSEVHLYDDCITQVKIHSRIKLKRLKEILALPDADIKLAATSLELNYANLSSDSSETLSPVILKGSSNPGLKLQNIELQKEEDHFKGAFDFVLQSDQGDYHESRVVEFSQKIREIGVHKIDRMTLQFNISIKSGDEVFDITGHESFSLDKSLASYGSIYRLNTQSDILEKKAVAISTRSPHIIKSMPLKPNIVAKFPDNSESTIFIGETVRLPVYVSAKNSKINVEDFEEISLMGTASLVDEAVLPLSLDLGTHASWSNMKEDEPLDLKQLYRESGQVDNEYVLHLVIRPKSLQAVLENNDLTNDFRVKLDLSVITKDKNKSTNSENSVIIYPVAETFFGVRASPFNFKLSISPRYREEGSSDMPCPFVIFPANSQLKVPSDEGYSFMPLPVRLWQVNLMFSDFEQYTQGLEIKSIKIFMEPNNPELAIEEVNEATVSRPNVITQMFTTRSKSGFSHRNVTVKFFATIDWKRKGSEDINSSNTHKWDVALPLSDPRVILVMEKLDGNRFKMKYVIENPTSRIFNFSTHLLTENLNAEWHFDEVKNLAPLQQASIPVLPFNRHSIVYYASVSSEADPKLLKLPVFKVFDVNYRVSLPTLVTTDDVIVKENNTLYWKP
ncbi:Piso0_005268 [Millerozyma farinosa CBS 7064]|uniref:Piso0_005268 protein n=1 Tax=Pichia sorbitophila (strain ATCC MYA-4447 / BCRC 22081 / CBS 7064 / NBRC 10061 / NRRL Y-12695) TaxID=559304 RepID=G8Y4N2_PICSO|nr:Piso0_005268 [Millerozyma farinosa CBS 7064]